MAPLLVRVGLPRPLAFVPSKLANAYNFADLKCLPFRSFYELVVEGANQLLSREPRVSAVVLLRVDLLLVLLS